MGSPELESKVCQIGSVLNDPGRPLKERFRALFTLRNIGGEAEIREIARCFDDDSALLKHELAYCLGQMQDPRALPVLTALLKDKSREAVVRHEAGEAIGAIGCESSLDVLREFAEDPVVEVAETCQLAIKRIEWLKTARGENGKGMYRSVDPAPPEEKNEDVKYLGKVLTDEGEDLFKRYRAMFALRDINTEESITALCKGFGASSALLRHEIAFVLGQLQNPCSVDALIKVLEDKGESDMVRHESAEALGSIATDECVSILKRYQSDKARIVRESCDVALDMAEYELSSDFQYANTAALVQS